MLPAALFSESSPIVHIAVTGVQFGPAPISRKWNTLLSLRQLSVLCVEGMSVSDLNSMAPLLPNLEVLKFGAQNKLTGGNF